MSREVWRRESALDHTLQSISLDLGNSERDLKSTTSRNTMRGIESAMKIAEDRQLTGVYGPLIDIFKCEPRVFTAVEVTAGNRQVSLFFNIFQYISRNRELSGWSCIDNSIFVVAVQMCGIQQVISNSTATEFR